MGITQGVEDYTRQILTFPHFDSNGLKRITVAWPGERILIKSDVDSLLLTRKKQTNRYCKKDILATTKKLRKKIIKQFRIFLTFDRTVQSSFLYTP